MPQKSTLTLTGTVYVTSGGSTRASADNTYYRGRRRRYTNNTTGEKREEKDLISRRTKRTTIRALPLTCYRIVSLLTRSRGVALRPNTRTLGGAGVLLWAITPPGRMKPDAWADETGNGTHSGVGCTVCVLCAALYFGYGDLWRR